MKHSRQMSESIRLGIILAMAGGFMDAYSYMCREQVFANAQTGNMLLFGINISEKNWNTALRYLFPVLAFAVGIAVADLARIFLKEHNMLHWRQVSLVIEICVLVIVGFMPQKLNLAANSLTSLACGIQVESFRKVHGNGIATTMCIGNLRSAIQNVCDYYYTKNKNNVERSMLYFGIIVCFIVGAVAGNMCVKELGERAILICSGVLFLAFVMMFADRERNGR